MGTKISQNNDKLEKLNVCFFLKFLEKNARGPDMVHNVKESGASYKPKDGTGGDVLIKGQPEPYAFI